MLKLFEAYKDYSELTEFINKVRSAKKFAEEKHKGQKRFGKGEDYIVHPDHVARIVHEVKHSHKIADLIVSAYLHDTVEDCGVRIEEIKEKFGDLVAELVKELTNDEEMIKIMGKEDYLIDKMIDMSSWGLIIKLADRLHNVSDLNDTNKKWSKDYAIQTKHIIKELEDNRDLTDTQKELVKMINIKLQEFNSKL
jgi:GTP pyrophosphokinase